DRNIVRVRYPRSRSSTTLEPLDVNTLASSSGGVVTAALDSGATIQITEPSGSSGQFQTVFAGRTPAAAAVALQPLLAPAIADQINSSRPRVRMVPATVERAHARADGYEL